MKHAFVLMGIVLMLAYSSIDAFGCSCDLPWPNRTLKQRVTKARNDSRAVFSGVVAKIDQAPYSISVTFKVERSWKGALPNQVVVLTGRGGGDCGYLFEMGQRYLVYAYGSNVSSLGTNICQRTAMLSESSDDLKILGKPRRSFS